MCLAIPGKIERIEGKKATVNFDGVKRNVDISLLDSVKLDDYVLVHVGFAIQKVDEEIARETYRLLDEIDKQAIQKELENE
jgi:hydrogenase expression/formation protein HypC